MVPETSPDSQVPPSTAATTSSSPPPPSLDLNLSIVPFPKLEPKPEPLDYEFPDPSPVGPTGPPPGLEPIPPPASPTADEKAVFAEYIRLAHLFAAAAPPGDESRALVVLPPPLPNPPPPPPPPPEASNAIVVSKKRKTRSAEMVRVASLALQDQLFFRDRVRRTRITFESLRALLIRDEVRDDETFNALWGRRGRPDLKAATLMGDRDLWLNRDRRIIGPIPGIGIGDVFLFRSELCVLGLHGLPQAGIDYVPASRSATGEPIATSIIVSGGYEDDDDHGLVLIYTGQGGRVNNMIRHSVDQKLEGGNLALERSMNYGIEIRVIRGVKCDRSPIGKVYVYDGLYKVIDYWVDIGKSGFGVYKYKMLRIEDQEEMGSSILQLADDLKANPLSIRPSGYLSLDMSMGKERYPVRLFNDIDDDRDPLLFEYLVRPSYAFETLLGKGNYHENEGCQCTSDCSPDSCYCAVKNCGEFAYNVNGVLLRGKPLIHECGTSCCCPPTCRNRVSQKGLTHRLEVFRSKETGWGVRSLDLIRAGTFVCEFSGIVLTKQQADIVSMNSECCFIHPSQFPGRWQEWGDITDIRSDLMPPESPSLPEVSFAIDVSRERNVACYLSHSNTPNVFAQFVLFDHHHVLYPHVMIFALENIPPLRELSIDYGIRDEWLGRLTM